MAKPAGELGSSDTLSADYDVSSDESWHGAPAEDHPGKHSLSLEHGLDSEGLTDWEATSNCPSWGEQVFSWPENSVLMFVMSP